MFRIRKTRWKVAYFAASLILLNVLDSYLVARFLPDPLASIVANLLTLTFVLGAARTFRGQGEPLKPPRVWWRGSARPTASFVIGGLWAADAVATIVVFALQPTAYYLAVGAATYVILAVFFINSAGRLQRFPQPTVPDPIPAPRFKPIKR
ncbi:hypothetical protein [Herbiconiux sp. UC225_62]|uniref:hypothetical protein n=1 Tax=Herbiconiux sp. UC225_62 TaxID=3350168 RepID=UPI0036D2253D